MIMQFTLAQMIFVLLGAHCFFDYAGQGDFMSQAKNPTTAMGKSLWWWVLPSHGLIHGGVVFLITGNLAFGIAETVIHTITDYLKCRNWISYSMDQTIHVVCKIAWALAVVPWGTTG